MEDIQAYHFQCNKAIQINSVRLFLKVNFLSKITDHTGRQLLPHMLEPQKMPPNLFYHTNPNQSTLQWPNQPSPGKSAWKQWHEAITWIYAQQDGITLSTPLGDWLPTYDHNYQWNWLIDPESKHLYHSIGKIWHTYRPICQTPTYIEYPAQLTPSAQEPAHSHPATPLLRPGRIRIALPLSNQLRPPPAIAAPNPSLITRLQTPPQPWARPLWHATQRHAPIGQLKQALLH